MRYLVVVQVEPQKKLEYSYKIFLHMFELLKLLLVFGLMFSTSKLYEVKM